MVIVVISNKKCIPASAEHNFTPVVNSIFINILPANHWFQRLYEAALISTVANSEKLKSLTKRYQIIFEV
jgi:hypothetical protein